MQIEGGEYGCKRCRLAPFDAIPTTSEKLLLAAIILRPLPQSLVYIDNLTTELVATVCRKRSNNVGVSILFKSDIWEKKVMTNIHNSQHLGGILCDIEHFTTHKICEILQYMHRINDHLLCRIPVR
jgi:hypothetical protein